MTGHDWQQMILSLLLETNQHQTLSLENDVLHCMYYTHVMCLHEYFHLSIFICGMYIKGCVSASWPACVGLYQCVLIPIPALGGSRLISHTRIS